tara:strand:- start:4258 stop:4476 length:219 start_codon:yes stop_codon:yes gene_type:complete
MDVEKIIAEQLDIDVSEVTDDKHIMDDLGADSLDTVQIVIDLEEEFDIQIYDEDVDSLETVGDVKEYIEENA